MSANESETEVRIFSSTKPRSAEGSDESFDDFDDVNLEDEDLIEGISLYDLNRAPLEVIPSDTINIPIRTITQELTCPICLGMINKTVTVMECLHRFCHQCLNISISQANKRQCPSCRAKLASLRNTRSDENFDEIINCLFPDREEYEAHMDELLTKIATEATQSSRLLMQQVEEGLKRQSLAKKKRFKTSSGSIRKKVKYNTPNHASLYFDEINFKLEPHSTAKLRGKLQRPWVTTNSTATINSLRKVLANIYFHSTDQWEDFRITVQSKGEGDDLKELSGELSLAEVYERHWLTPDEKLTLLYWTTPSKTEV